jgi:hypothetical protein
MGRIIKNGIIYSDSTIAIQPVIYAEEEREIGVWTDGKPVYEKTLYSAGGVQGNFNITHNISNIDRVISYSGTVKDTDPQWAAIWTIPRIASDGNNLGINYTNDTVINIINPNAFGTRLVDWYITIQYTKTTDRAGSGQWTPQGVPAVHYSTDEKVVGTWIDGSTIYDKTIYVPQLPNGTATITTPANVSMLIDAFGFAYNTVSDGYYRPIPFAGGGSNDIRIDMQDGSFRIVTFAAWTNYAAYITFRYTKSST